MRLLSFIGNPMNVLVLLIMIVFIFVSIICLRAKHNFLGRYLHSRGKRKKGKKTAKLFGLVIQLFVITLLPSIVACMFFSDFSIFDTFVLLVMGEYRLSNSEINWGLIRLLTFITWLSATIFAALLTSFFVRVFNVEKK